MDEDSLAEQGVVEARDIPHGSAALGAEEGIGPTDPVDGPCPLLLAHVRGKTQAASTQLLGANRRLLKAHLPKESLGHLSACRSKTWALRFFAQWVEQLKCSRLELYQKFTRMVARHLDGILAYCDKPVSLDYIVGADLKGRNIIRRAFRSRNKEYVQSKIIQDCSSLGVFRSSAYADNSPSSA